MAYTWTQPNTITNYTVDDNYIVVTLYSNHKMRCKKSLLKPEDYAFFYGALKAKTPVRFGAFVPWNPYKWFITWEAVEFKAERVIVHANKDKLLLKHATAWASKYLKLNTYGAEKALIISVTPFAEGAGLLGYAEPMKLKSSGNQDGETVELFHGFIGIKEQQLMSEILRVLFHELVHFKQFVSGELVGSKWKGKQIDTDVVPYRLLPWEIEAWAMMDVMLDAYISESQ